LKDESAVGGSPGGSRAGATIYNAEKPQAGGSVEMAATMSGTILIKVMLM
jgi:hypothetical protein